MKENKREATFTCGGCLEEFPMDQLHEFDGRNLCPKCFREETMVCSVCGERFAESFAHLQNGEIVCSACYRPYTRGL